MVLRKVGTGTGPHLSTQTGGDPAGRNWMSMTDDTAQGLSDAELEAEDGTGLPDKEVVSILDLNADLDLALDVAAPIDLAVAANANVAAPIDAAVSANILSAGSTAQAMGDQGVIIDQGITGDVSADANQDSVIGTDGGTAQAPAEAGSAQSPADAGTAPGMAETGTTAPAATDAPAAPAQGIAAGEPGPGLPIPDQPLPDQPLPDVPPIPDPGGVTDVGSALDGGLLNVDVDLAADAGITAPITGAVAANANVAAPIDAAVAANIGSVDSDAVAVAQQDAIITQTIDGDATADADQTSDITNP
jgi:hypothetical protein